VCGKNKKTQVICFIAHLCPYGISNLEYSRSVKRDGLKIIVCLFGYGDHARFGPDFYVAVLRYNQR
jgi:hypothetical protein